MYFKVLNIQVKKSGKLKKNVRHPFCRYVKGMLFSIEGIQKGFLLDLGAEPSPIKVFLVLLPPGGRRREGGA